MKYTMATANVNATPPDQVLTVGKCLRSLSVSILWSLLGGAISIGYWFSGSKLAGAAWAIVCLVRLLTLPVLWKQYSAVRSGVILYAQPQPQLLVSRSVSVCAASVLTLVVGAASIAFVAILIDAHRPLTEWMIFAAIDLALWAYVGYCWHRALQEEPQVETTVEYDEPQEGVWPPPPSVPTDNKDLSTR